MARLRQLFPFNYGNPSNTSSEFENLIRYLNSAEFGNKTLTELLEVLFNRNGELDAPVEMRLDPLDGFQYRLGSYERMCVPMPATAWRTIATPEELRGAPGVSCGSIVQPMFSTRVDVVNAAGQVFIELPIDDTVNVLAYRNGLLMSEGPTADYTVEVGSTATATGIRLTTPLTVNDRVSCFLALGDAGAQFRRQDTLVTIPGTTLSFVFSPNEKLMVYKNGVLLTEGGSADYLATVSTNTIVFHQPLVVNDRVTVMVVEDTTKSSLVGLMLANDYTNPQTGMILGRLVEFQDKAIPQVKVDGLPEAIALMPSFTESLTEPAPPTTFWLRPIASIGGMMSSELMFWDGIRYLSTTGSFGVPPFVQADALRFLQVDPTGSFLRWSAPDLSAYLLRTQIGAANGVAALDSNGRIPLSQMPSPGARYCQFIQFVKPVVANDVFVVHREYLNKSQVIGVTARLGAGTGSIQMKVQGIPVWGVVALTVSQQDFNLPTPVLLDGMNTSVRVEFQFTAAANAADPEFGLTIENLAR